jgi:hypothetical protein
MFHWEVIHGKNAWQLPSILLGNNPWEKQLVGTKSFSEKHS